MPLISCRWIVLVIGAALASCGRDDQIVTLSGVTYYFPAAHLEAFVERRDGGDIQHGIRLVPPPGHYLLEHIPWRTGRKKDQESHVPTIPWVNSAPGAKVDVIDTNAGVVVCRANPGGLHYTCGLRLIDNGVVWNVRFDRDLLGSADAIKTRAHKTLLTYRTDDRLKSN